MDALSGGSRCDQRPITLICLRTTRLSATVNDFALLASSCKIRNKMWYFSVLESIQSLVRKRWSKSEMRATVESSSEQWVLTTSSSMSSLFENWWSQCPVDVECCESWYFVHCRRALGDSDEIWDDRIGRANTNGYLSTLSSMRRRK